MIMSTERPSPGAGLRRATGGLRAVRSDRDPTGSAGRIGAPISANPLPRGSSCRRTSPGRRLRRGRGISTRFEANVHPELTAKFDLDVADMARPIDPPRRSCAIASVGSAVTRGGRRVRTDLAERASHGKHPCLPAAPQSDRRGLFRSGSIRDVRIDEMRISLNFRLGWANARGAGVVTCGRIAAPRPSGLAARG